MNGSKKYKFVTFPILYWLILFSDMSAQIGLNNKSEFYYLKGKDTTSLRSTLMNRGFDEGIKSEKSLQGLYDTFSIGFSVRSGFYENPFNLILTSPDTSLDIIYTLDGSNPQNSATSYIAASSVTITVDPESTEGRPVTPSVIVRASVCKSGYKPSIPVSRTYIFAEKVKTQSWPEGEWPSWDINGQLIDLDMDSKVVNDSLYSGQVLESLLGIPSISIITDIKNLFDSDSGIYVNATGHGLDWERECSAELIHADGSEGFNINAGLRIRGGWSRGNSFPKHSFRLFFREIYGKNKLYYPLFGNEGVEEFDKIDLRTEQDFAWSNGFPNNSMVREVFSRDSQRDMNQPYTRSRYYHLYLNGMYWGLYQTQERSEASYAQSYFGGKEEDYDVIKVDNMNDNNIEATDGTLDSWHELWEMCQNGFISNSDYFRIDGKDQFGNPVKGGRIMVDLDNLIDFMIVIFYTGNFDGPSSSFMENKGANNFYAIDNREDNSRGFTFYTHDAEISLFDEAQYMGIGLLEDRVNIGTRTDSLRMEVYGFEKFHPQWLHFKLSANPEYRIRFADRAWKHLSAGGVFSPAKALERINKRINEVDIAVVAESARWGDAMTSGSFAYTKNEYWEPEINKIRNNFIPFRTGIVIDQLKIAGLYPGINAPVIRAGGEIVTATELPVSSQVIVQIENPNNSGTIYYSLDGSDPRKILGEISSGAQSSHVNVSLSINSSTVITARVFDGDQWSAICRVNIIKEQRDFTDLKITELHYHPSDYIVGNDTTDGKDLEFIELKNIGEKSINLSGLVLDSAVSYIFPLNSLLEPKQFYVIASKPSKFFDYYGLVASGNFQGNFSNGGEQVLLYEYSGKSIIDFIYDDAYPWPDAADGGGFSLASAEINPSGNPAYFSYWRLSGKKGGSPFSDDLHSPDENPDLPDDRSLIVYPNPTTGLVNIHLVTEFEAGSLDLLIFSTTGKLIGQTIIGNPGTIDLYGFGLPAGVYIIKISSSNYSGWRAVILTK